MTTIQNWKRKIASSSLILLLIGGAGATQIAAASSINEAGLTTLGISEAQYDDAKDDAKAAYNAEMVDLGWVSAETAAEATAEDHWVKVGRGTYYQGILDKEAFVADALGISEAQLDAAQEASQDAKVAERIEEGRMTAAEAADREALQDFKDSIDDEAVLAQSLGITVSELNTARAENMSYEALLSDLGLTSEEVKANATAIKQQLVNDAVEDGTLTAEQAENMLQGRRNKGRGNGGQAPDGEPQVNRGVRARQNNQDADAPGTQPANEAPTVGSYDS